MATDFLLEWVGEAAESGRRKADVLEQFAAEVTSRPTADSELELRRRTAFTRQGIAACLLMADTIPVMWDSVLDRLRRGTPRETATRLVTAFLSTARAIGEWTAAFLRLIAAFPRDVLPVEPDAAGALASVEPNLAPLVADATKMLDALRKPSSPVDDERLAAGIKAAAEGRTKGAGDAIAAIRALRAGS
jgi:hypothetical protein